MAKAVELLDVERRLLRSFSALPQCERDAFLREIEVASLRWRCALADGETGFPPAALNPEWTEFQDDDPRVKAADDEEDDDDDWPAT